MTTATEFQPDEIVEVGLQSWYGKTWHRAKVVRECVRRGSECVEVIWLETAFRKVAGRTYWPPKAAVRKVAASILLVLAVAACAGKQEPITGPGGVIGPVQLPVPAPGPRAPTPAPTPAPPKQPGPLERINQQTQRTMENAIQQQINRQIQCAFSDWC